MELKEWAYLKDLIDRYTLSNSYVDCSNHYIVLVGYLGVVFSAKVAKNTSDATDFETNYK